MRLEFGTRTLELTPSGGGYQAALGEWSAFVEVRRAADGRLDLLIDGQPVRAHVSAEGAKRWVTVNGRTWALDLTTGARRGGAAHAHPSGLTAPMPGQVRSVEVRAGDAVQQGQTLLVIEAMKMETRIQSPADGTVKKVFVEQGQTVEREQMLIEIDEA
jgi:biotin carboxyl carrier protein